MHVQVNSIGISDLACMRIFMTSVGQAMADDTLPEEGLI